MLLKRLIPVALAVLLATPAVAGPPGFDLGRGFRLDIGSAQIGGGGITKDPLGQLMMGIDMFAISHGNLVWTLFEAQLGVREDGAHTAVVHSKLGYAYPLDDEGYHRLQIGVGLGGGKVSDEPVGFVMVPYVRYQWAISLGVEAILPVSNDSEGRYVAAFMAYIGFSLEMLGG